jgi:organic radical activating enzyme
VAEAFVAEIMESIQGEGLWMGCRQAFVRLCGCNLRCAYCDTRGSWGQHQPECQVYRGWEGQETLQRLPNPLAVDQLLGLVEGFSAPWVAVTGGEPLLWPAFLGELLPALRARGRRVLLETNGTLGDALARVVHEVDVISMDFKLPSAVGEDLRETHRRFLCRAAERDVYVKVVVDGATSDREVREAAECVAAVDPLIPLVLQPVSPREGAAGVGLARLGELQRVALDVLDDVRVIPQLHRYLGAR